MVAEKPQLMAVTESMIDLTDELIAFADDIGEQQDHLLDPDLLRRDIHGYLRLLDDWSRGSVYQKAGSLLRNIVTWTTN